MTALRMADIRSAVCAHYGLSPEDMSGRSQTRRHTRPRQIAMYLCLQLTGKSSTQVGHAFSRDHTTVLYAETRIGGLIKGDPDLADDIAVVTEVLLAGAH